MNEIRDAGGLQLLGGIGIARDNHRGLALKRLQSGQNFRGQRKIFRIGAAQHDKIGIARGDPFDA